MNYYCEYVHGWYNERRFRGPYRSIKAALAWAVPRAKLTKRWVAVIDKTGRVYAEADWWRDNPPLRHRGGFVPGDGMTNSVDKDRLEAA